MKGVLRPNERSHVQERPAACRRLISQPAIVWWQRSAVLHVLFRQSNDLCRLAWIEQFQGIRAVGFGPLKHQPPIVGPRHGIGIVRTDENRDLGAGAADVFHVASKYPLRMLL